MGQLIILAVFAVLMYVLLILPQQKRVKAQQALLSSLSEGDHVLTTSGVYGNIVEFEGSVIWLEVAKGVEIKVAREAVQAIIGDDSDETSDKNDKNDKSDKNDKNDKNDKASVAAGDSTDSNADAESETDEDE